MSLSSTGCLASFTALEESHFGNGIASPAVTNDKNEWTFHENSFGSERPLILPRVIRTNKD